MAGFDRPAQAINFALQAQAEFTSARQAARIGIDFGPVELLDGELNGHAVYRAYEVCGLPEPAQSQSLPLSANSQTG